MSTFKDRLIQAMREKNMSMSELSTAADIPYPTLAAWRRGSVLSMRGERANRVANVLGVNLVWLNTGEGAKNPLATVTKKNLPTGSTLIPVYDLSFGCGDSEQPEFEELTQAPPAVISTAWLIQVGATPNMCKAFIAQGDSMEPKIPDGSTVIVDTSPINSIQDGHIYAFAFDHSLRIKVLSKTIQGGIVISSINPAYPTEQASKEECEQYFHYVGAVKMVISAV